MNNISFVVYSHSTYSDLWAPFFSRAEKHVAEEFEKYYFFVDSVDVPLATHIPEKYEVVYYDDSAPYTDRLRFCLEQIETEYCIFQHEDMILYDDVKVDLLRSIWDVTQEEEIDYIKLLKGGAAKDTKFDTPHTKNPSLRKIYPGFDYIVAIQSSIWKVATFLEIATHHTGLNIWEFEAQAQHFCRYRNYKCYYSFVGNEKRRGRHHWDSYVWPVIATAIFKGKWTVDQYPGELREIFSQYGIDPEERGTC
jgi:hypothetical protein